MNVMLGYYKNENATAQTIDKNGWLHTGDMAIKDAEGNIFIKGRCKNMLLTALDRTSIRKKLKLA